MDDKLTDMKRRASGRKISIVEGFVTTIGMSIGGVYAPNFVLTEFMIKIMHASNFLIGFANSIIYYPGILQPLFAILLRRVSRRPLIFVSALFGRGGFIIAILFVLLFPGETSKAAFPFVLVLSAVFSALGFGWSTLMADLVPESMRGKYFALRNALASVSGFVVILLAGYILKNYSDPAQLPAGFLIIYLIAFVANSIGAMFFLFQYDPPSTEVVTGSVGEDFKKIFADGNFLRFIGMSVFFTFVLSLTGPFYNVYILEYLKMPYDTLSLCTALAVLVSILGLFFWGKISDIIGNRIVARITLMALMFQPVLWIFVRPESSLLSSVLLIILPAFFGAGWGLVSYNSLLSISPNTNRSLYLGIYSSFVAVAGIVAPLIGGGIIDYVRQAPFVIAQTTFHPAVTVFAGSAFLMLIGLIFFPYYRESRENAEYGFRGAVFDLNLPSTLFRIFMSTFKSNIVNRQRLVDNMADSKNPMATAPLIKLLKDTEYEVRIAAIEGLGKIGTQSALKALLEFYPQAHDLEKKDIIRVLKHFSESEAQQLLIKALSSSNDLVVAEASQSLGQFPVKEVTRIVLSRLANEKNLDLFLVYFELLSKHHSIVAIPIALERYNEFSSPIHQRELLYHFSRMFGIRKQFYRFLSIDNEHESHEYFMETLLLFLNALKNERKGRLTKTLNDRINSFSQSVSQFFEATGVNGLFPYREELISLCDELVRDEYRYMIVVVEFFLNRSQAEIAEYTLVFMVLRQYVSKEKWSD